MSSRSSRRLRQQPQLARLVGGPIDGSTYPYPDAVKRREHHVIAQIIDPPRVAVYIWFPGERVYRHHGNVLAADREEAVAEIARITDELPGLL